MRTITKTARIAVGGMLLAVAVYMILAVPGLISNQDSIVPDHETEAMRG